MPGPVHLRPKRKDSRTGIRLRVDLKRASIRVKSSIHKFESARKRRLAGKIIAALISHALMSSGASSGEEESIKAQSRVAKFKQLLDALMQEFLSNSDARSELAYALGTLNDPTPVDSLLRGMPRVRVAQRAISTLHDMTQKILFVANEATKTRAAQRRGRRGHHWKLLLIIEAAEVFEFLTGNKPSRKIRGEDHPDYGKPYGEFWAFLSSLWMNC